MFGRLQSECGYTPDQIRSMTLFDVDRLFKFWSRHPPQGDLMMAIAKVLGIEYSLPTQKQRINSMSSAMAALSAMKSMGGNVGRR